MAGELRLIIVSGLSGSGKSVALHVLEDVGYYCIDNLPASLLMAAVEEVRRRDDSLPRHLAVGVDARNHATNLDELPDLLHQLQGQGVSTDIIFLQASDDILLQRYSGQEDIVVGSPIANRRHGQLEDLIGRTDHHTTSVM